MIDGSYADFYDLKKKTKQNKSLLVLIVFLIFETHKTPCFIKYRSSKILYY